MLNKSLLLLSLAKDYWVLNIRQEEVVAADANTCRVIFTLPESIAIEQSFPITELNTTYRILVPKDLRCEILTRQTMGYSFTVVSQENVQVVTGSYIGRRGIQIEDSNQEGFLVFTHSLS